MSARAEASREAAPKRALAWIRARPALLIAAGLVCVALWEIVVIARAGSGDPSEAEWRAAASAIEGRHRPDDLIVFAPHWIDPLARVYVGHLVTVEQAARMDATRYARIFEVSTRGARAPETRGLGAPAWEARFGRVQVRLYERTAPAVLWDLRGRSKLLEVDYAPRLCVPVTIAKSGGRLDLGTVSLGSRLVVYGGLSDFRSRKANRSRARLRVLVDDRELASATIGNDSGWVRLAADTPAGAHRVLLEADAQGTPATLSLCVQAEAYP